MKKWQIAGNGVNELLPETPDLIIKALLKNRNLTTEAQVREYLHPRNPDDLSADDVEIGKREIELAVKRIKKAIRDKESIVVYADYDADGITAGAIMWETVHKLGGIIMPYIPHRVEEGYGLSIRGIDTVIELYKPSLIITVDHGITAKEKVAYAKSKGVEVIVTDHHVKPLELPDCLIIHTTKLCGAGVSWFLAKELITAFSGETLKTENLLELATIGTIADMVPLLGANRSITKYGLKELNKTSRIGLNALIENSGLIKGNLGTYDVSHVIAPRLNAMGRLDHALDALRLLCTKQVPKAHVLAAKLGFTNQERQQLTLDTTSHALQSLQGKALEKRLLFVSHETYNQGVIGLVAGKIVEAYYRPSIVVSVGEVYSKASARSITGFNIVEAIRSCSDILIDVGGHPMAAGFTVETKFLSLLRERLEKLAQNELDDDKLTRVLKIDMGLPIGAITFDLWEKLQDFEPFGFGNPEPVFASHRVKVQDIRAVGNGNKHLKLTLQADLYNQQPVPAIAFGMGELAATLRPGDEIDIAYAIDVDTWNGNRRLQLKIKDIHTK